MTNLKVATLLTISLLWFTDSLIAQSIQDNISITKLTGTITIDGKVDETEWSTITPLPLTMHWPNYNGNESEPTEIRLVYDDEYIYLSAICHETDLSQIQMPTFQRDDWGLKKDQIAFLLDTYDDNENMLVFVITPTGSRIDASIKNDAQGSGVSNESWNTYWTGQATVTEIGWEAEMKIPFSSLRFNVEDDKVKMGLIAYRYIARNKELNIYPDIPPNWGFWSFAKPSKAQTVTFEGVKNKRPWYISPYALGAVGHHHEEDDKENLIKINDDDIQVGLDVQHAISDNLNADFTFNTDFAQVEADDQVVNLSRFSLFFPEKRKFFLERSSVFDFKNDKSNNLFYSRNIGINDGQRVPVWGGIRLTGRMNGWDVGLLNMQSQKIEDIASENFGVFRLRKNVFNQRSYLGSMLTSRIGSDGEKNFAYGVDAIINVFKDDYLQVNLSQSQDTEDSDSLDLFDKSRIYLEWENQSSNGFAYRVSYSNVGNDFNPGLGFERRKNFNQFGDQVSYSWFADENSELRKTIIELNADVSFSNATGKLETSSVGLFSEWSWNRGTSISISAKRFRDVVPEAFDLSDDIMIYPADYSNTLGRINYETPQVNMASLSVSFEAGSFYGGDLISASISPEFVFSKYFQLSGFYEYNYIDFPSLQETFQSHVARVTMRSSLNVKLSMSAFAQLNTLQNISAMNFRLRYNPIDGNDLYFVFNEVLNNDPNSEMPALPTSDTRAFLVKYIHTFKL